MIDQVKTLGIARLPIGDILAHLANLGENFQQAPQTSETADASLEADEAKLEAFVRLSRNASSANRSALERAGLHWNGRAAGWTGHVTAAGLERLRSVFGKRVEKPDLADPAGHVAKTYHVQMAAPPGCEAAARAFYGDVLGLTEVPKPAVIFSATLRATRSTPDPGACATINLIGCEG